MSANATAELLSMALDKTISRLADEIAEALYTPLSICSRSAAGSCSDRDCAHHRPHTQGWNFWCECEQSCSTYGGSMDVPVHCVAVEAVEK